MRSIQQLNGIKLVGISAVVPDGERLPQDDYALYGQTETDKLVASTGVERRCITTADVCTSDLCLAAANRLLDELDCSLDSIDMLIFLSQTPDYILPATACVLHGKLGLSKKCAAFDINLGCSGYTYGLWMASNFIKNGAVNRVLLLVGDTISKVVASENRATFPLFGDAGTATLLESDTESASKPWSFAWGTDGLGANHLMVKEGGFRSPDLLSDDQFLSMNGAEVFAFTLAEIPGLLQSLLDDAKWTFSDVDAVVFHQANAFMLKYLAKRMKINSAQLPMCLSQYGNTSSASIPLTLCGMKQSSQPQNLVLAGFGVGYSWCGVSLVLDEQSKRLEVVSFKDAML